MLRSPLLGRFSVFPDDGLGGISFPAEPPALQPCSQHLVTDQQRCQQLEPCAVQKPISGSGQFKETLPRPDSLLLGTAEANAQPDVPKSRSDPRLSHGQASPAGSISEQALARSQESRPKTGMLAQSLKQPPGDCLAGQEASLSPPSRAAASSHPLQQVSSSAGSPVKQPQRNMQMPPQRVHSSGLDAGKETSYCQDAMLLEEPPASPVHASKAKQSQPRQQPDQERLGTAVSSMPSEQVSAQSGKADRGSLETATNNGNERLAGDSLQRPTAFAKPAIGRPDPCLLKGSPAHSSEHALEPGKHQQQKASSGSLDDQPAMQRGRIQRKRTAKHSGARSTCQRPLSKLRPAHRPCKPEQKKSKRSAAMLPPGSKQISSPNEARISGDSNVMRCSRYS